MKRIRNSEKGLWICIGALSLSALLAQCALALRRADAVPEPSQAEDAEIAVQYGVRANAMPDVRRTTETLVDAIIQVESAENPTRVGRHGERGLMQIKRSTWAEVTRRLYGRARPFDHAFNPGFNRFIGKAYLAYLQGFLHARREDWRSDERSLLLACYNAGPKRVQQAGFDLRRLPRTTRQYVDRVTALHELYLAEDAPLVRQMLLSQARIGRREDRSS